jgi:hypothetical protein
MIIELEEKRKFNFDSDFSATTNQKFLQSKIRRVQSITNGKNIGRIQTSDQFSAQIN